MYVSPLPSQFWQAPPTLSEDMKIVHTQLVATMRSEFKDMPNFGAIDEMVIERTCYLYVYIRDKEIQGTSWGNERAYKETTQLWNEMVRDLRKVRAGSIEEGQLRDKVYMQVAETLNKVFNSMDPKVAAPLRAQFAEELDSQTL